MDWRVEAVDTLKQYRAKQEALQTIPLQIAEIESAMTSIRSGVNITPAGGGTSTGRENMLLNCIVQKEELSRSLQRAGLWVQIVDRGLSILDADERKILDRFFITGGKRAAEDLSVELFADIKTIYRWKDAALRKFTIALYGGVES